MHFFRKASIQSKLTFVILCTSLVGLSLACLAFEVYERATYRAGMTSELSALADTLGGNAAAALTFNDRKAANDILKALRAEHHIVAACLYDSHNRDTIFAEYRRSSLGLKCAAFYRGQDGAQFEKSSLTLYRTVFLEGEKAGTLAIVSDLDELHDKIHQYTEISVVVILLSVLATYFVSSRLLRLITEPILHLSEIASRVTAKEDYALRASPRADDEVGALIEAFNQMLERIQERDAALQHAKDDLELRVQARTMELQLEVKERTRAEEKLHSSLKELEDLKFALDQHCIVARTDHNGIITFVNDKFCSISKFSRNELLGRDHSLINSKYHPKEYIRELWQTIKAGRVWKGELRNRAKDGSYYWVDTTIVPFCDSQGKPRQFIAIRSDITALKRIEDDLRSAKNAAEAASQAKSEFLANMSHEIRTPLNGVIGMTELALDTQLNAEQREYLETVKISGESLLTVINDILDFSKIEAGKIDLEAIDFSLRDCLESTLKTLAVRADEKGLELLCEIAPEVLEVVRGDSSRLRQIVTNLVGNAIKFTERGEVALKVQLDSREGSEGLFHLTVSDTGIGIPKDKLGLIFDPFSQADSSTTRKYGGTGLGLTICSRLVKMMGGRIWAESEPGRGSQFHFTVSLGIADAKAIQLGTIAPPEFLRDVRVLIVDDNRTNRRILDGMLKRWEMRPESVEGGAQALTQLSKAWKEGDPYRLILTDMNMPDMNGFEMIERIRQMPELSTATIMMLTSTGHRGDAARCQKLGVAAYLLKPIRQSELREAIARVLGARQQEGAIPLITRFSLHDAREQEASLRVLLAEDNLVNQRLAVRLLEKRGHRVAVAATGKEALAALEKASFDLVLMDVQMPEMDGLEATVAIRQKERASGAHQPIIALTAHAMKGDREKCLAAGMDGYLTKPIRPRELDQLLESYVAQRMEARSASETVPQEK
jgi:two-component system, sensor histidine kinase and response regulator